MESIKMEKWTLRELLLALIVAVVIIAIASAVIGIFYPYNYGYGNGMMGGYGMMGGFGIGVGFMMIVPIILIIIIIWALLPNERYYPQSYQQTQQQNSLEILSQRYARGEVSREEYLKVKEDLKK